MKKFITLLLLLPALKSYCSFEQYFSDGTLRIDYYFAGNDKETHVFFDEMYKEPLWGGTKTLPKSKDNMGNFRYNLYSKETGLLLYSRGMSTLFHEWKTTTEAKEISRTMQVSAIMPFPTSQVMFEIEERNMQTGKFNKIFSLYINPENYFILPGIKQKCEWKKLIDNGDPANLVDIAFIAEGYTASEKDKFYSDVARISNHILSQPPFNEHKNKFNVYALAAVSEESGTDIPGRKIYKNTALNSTFYTFNVDRYLATTDNKSIFDVAANVPYDAIIILVNSGEYGGGGFYNWYSLVTSDNSLSENIAVHELGHSFAGLADEYYTSEVAYNDFYNLKVEPWEENITTLVDFNSKWKDMVTSGTPTPTLRERQYRDVVGVFEGGGYAAKGIYSPMQDCMMNSGRGTFCPVCQRTIEKMIDYLTEIEN